MLKSPSPQSDHSQHYCTDTHHYNHIKIYRLNLIHDKMHWNSDVLQRLIQCGGQDCPLADLSKVRSDEFTIKKASERLTFYNFETITLHNKKHIKDIKINNASYNISFIKHRNNRISKVDPGLADIDTSCYTSPGNMTTFNIGMIPVTKYVLTSRFSSQYHFMIVLVPARYQAVRSLLSQT